MRKTNVGENSGLSEGAARERGAAECVLKDTAKTLPSQGGNDLQAQ